jgi:hypothetical protein
MFLEALAKCFFRRNVFVFDKKISQRFCRYLFITAGGGAFFRGFRGTENIQHIGRRKLD